MPLPTWSELQKDQTSPETIEQAIARLITAHLADSDAHLSPGESLEAHRTSSIIDHENGSIGEDAIDDEAVTSEKITGNDIVGKSFKTSADVGIGEDGVIFDSSGIQLWQDGEKTADLPVSGDPYFAGIVKASGIVYSRPFLYTAFENVADWDSYNMGPARLGSAMWQTGNTTNSTSYGWIESGVDYWNPVSNNPRFETCVIFGHDDAQLAYFGVGANPASDFFSFGGFKVVNNSLYGCVTDSDGTEYLTSAFSGITLTNWNTYRVEVPSANVYNFYVNDVLKGTITQSGLQASPVVFSYYIKTTEDVSHQIVARYASIMSNL